jgi:hypothetical protein
VDKINLLSKLVNPENFDNSVKNRFLEVAQITLTICRQYASCFKRSFDNFSIISQNKSKLPY